MITEMIIGIAKKNVECHASIEFSQVLLNICAIAYNKVNYIEVTMACTCTTSIIKT